eukprot:GDKJ01015639.1.p1 GENE.GDKJ01015639.1~~GDKJ01015639.1.p1  ORF type:complete len:1479 (-),score=376.60 GDKJ01015639.1:106-4311(-)
MNICQIKTEDDRFIAPTPHLDIVDADIAEQTMIQIEILRHLKRGVKPPLELVEKLQQFVQSSGLVPLQHTTEEKNALKSMRDPNRTCVSVRRAKLIKQQFENEEVVGFSDVSGGVSSTSNLGTIPPHKRTFMSSNPETVRDVPMVTNKNNIFAIPRHLRIRGVLEKRKLDFKKLQEEIRKRVSYVAKETGVLPERTKDYNDKFLHFLPAPAFSKSLSLLSLLAPLSSAKEDAKELLEADVDMEAGSRQTSTSTTASEGRGENRISPLANFIASKASIFKGRNGSLSAPMLEYQSKIGANWTDKRAFAALLATKCAEIVNASASLRSEVESKGEKERLKMLREANMDEYMKLVKDSKNERLKQLLAQTDNFLSELLQRAREGQRQKKSQEDEVEDKQAESKEDKAEGEGGDVLENAIVETSSEQTGLLDYYRATHLRREIVSQPPNFAEGRQLMSYQLTGLEWMVSLFNNNLHGILADEMGLGKTVMTIALFAHLLHKYSHTGPHLVVVPLSTLPNWLAEAEAFCPSLRVISYSGNPAERTEAAAVIKASRNFCHHTHTGVTHRGNVIPNGAHGYKRGQSAISAAEKRGFDVVLTTYEYVVRDSKIFQSTVWGHVVVDEGHRLKNVNSKIHKTLSTLKSMSRLLLTGTPLQNNLTELWSLLNYLLPHIFSSSADFESWFASPFTSSNSGIRDEDVALSTEERLLIVHRLHQTLRPFVLRRVKKDVLDQLPKKKEMTVWVPLSSWQVRLYAQASNKSITLAKNIEGESVRPQQATGLLDDEIAAMLNGFNGAEGGGQLAKTGNNNKYVSNAMVELRKACNHPYHYLSEWQPFKDVFNAPTSSETRDDNTGAWDGNFDELTMRLRMASGKFEFLERLLVKLFKCSHKVLLFAQHTTLIDILEAYLRCMSGKNVLSPNGIKLFRLDGSVVLEERRRRMDAFNCTDDDYHQVHNPEGKSKLFLISTRAGGTGLNLQTADTVIIFDSDWNPQQDLQAMARAHRVGQKREVRIIRLLTLTPFEETVMQRVESKLGLDSAVIGELTTMDGVEGEETLDETDKKREQQDRLKALIAINDNEGGFTGRTLSTMGQVNAELARGEEEREIMAQIDKKALKSQPWFETVLASGYATPSCEQVMKSVDELKTVNGDVPLCVKEFAEEYDLDLEGVIQMRDCLIEAVVECTSDEEIVEYLRTHNPVAHATYTTLFNKLVPEGLPEIGEGRKVPKEVGKRGRKKKEEIANTLKESANKKSVVDVEEGTLLNDCMLSLTKYGEVDPVMIILVLTGRLMSASKVPSWVLNAEREVALKVKLGAGQKKNYDDLDLQISIERDRLLKGNTDEQAGGIRRRRRNHADFASRMQLMKDGVFTGDGVEFLDEDDLQEIDRLVEEDALNSKRGRAMDSDEDFSD